ncbi:MAG: cysteine desulfurase family protein [Patescibacteria group bacterium]
MKKRIYLDYAASTPIDKKVLEAMLPYLRKHHGNPSSTHGFGQKAKAAIEEAREKAAKFLHCSPLEVVFTSGATEANNLAIQGVIQYISNQTSLLEESPARRQDAKPHIVTSQIEHESVLEPCKMLEKEGVAQVTYVPVTKEGFVRVEDVEKAIQENTVLVSIMYANSEIGTIQPITEIGQLLRKHNLQDATYKILFHTDAVQAANYLDCNVEKLGVDLLTLSAHKVYGPKGIGLLYVREGASLHALLGGGGQEGGLRSGTEDVAGIVGFGVALQELQNPRMLVVNIKTRQLRDTLVKKVLRRIPESVLTGSQEKRLANNTHFRFHGIEGRDLVLLLDQKGIAVSAGSACSETTQEPSHVLLALGLEQEEALSSVRITIGKYTKLEEIEKVIKVLTLGVAKLRKGGV